MNGLSSMVNREKKDAAQIVVWNGLNRTDGATDGFLSDCLNLTSDNYPTLSPRKGRSVDETYDEPTALYAWDKPVVVASNILYYDGEPVANVSTGAKQFAVVGSRLCVWPDMVIVDLNNGEAFRADAKYKTAIGSGAVVFGANTITALSDPLVAYGLTKEVVGDNWTASSSPARHTLIYTYGTDRAAVEACWQNNAWDFTSLGADADVIKTFWDTAGEPYSTGLITEGDIFIPKITQTFIYASYMDTYTTVTGVWYEGDADTEEYVTFPNKMDYNAQGLYAVVTNRRQSKPGYTNIEITYDVYKVGGNNPLFSDSFFVGDAVKIEGTYLGWYDRDRLTVQAVSDSPNTLTFGEVSAFADKAIAYKDDWSSPDLVKNSQYYIRYRKNSSESWSYYNFTATEDVSDHSLVVFIAENNNAYFISLWDTTNKRERYRFSATKSSGSSGTGLGTADTYEADTVSVEITRDIPPLDYVCTWNNRLWGVANNEMNKVWNEDKQEYEESYSRVIYGSALGMPWQFYDFSGLATDSYAAVVASKGDFTGISAYSRSLCCFKEDMLYRVSGDFPAEYAIYDYNVAGVMQGCHKSLKIVNEVLYYKGRDGFYAYSGSTPRLISYVLGHNKGVARATATERKYYAGLEYDDDDGELLVYDTITNTWYKEDDTIITDITCFAGNVTFIADGKIYTEDDPDSTEVVEWSATFVRANETFHERKDYKWLRIRADMEEGSTLKAEVSIDRGEWITVLPTTTINGLKMIEMPIKNNRVDEYVLRLSGKGQGKIRSVIREFHEGSTAR